VDSRHYPIGRRLVGAAGGDGFRLASPGVPFALLGGGERDVGQRDVDAGAGGDVGDAGTHHPGADDAEACATVGGLAGGSAATGLDALGVEEGQVDAVLGDLPRGQADEVPGLDQRRRVEVDLGAFDRRGQDGPLGRGRCAARAAAQRRRQSGELDGQRPTGGRAARDREAGGVPGLQGVAMCGDPGDGPRDEVGAVGDDLVDQTEVERRARGVARAGQQHRVERAGDPEQAGGADHAAAGGQQPQPDLGQADPVAWRVGDDPVVRRQRELEPAAESGAVDRGDDRAAERLQRAQLRLDVAEVCGETRGVFRP